MVWAFVQELARKFIHITILIALAAYFFIQNSLAGHGYSPILAKQVALLFLLLLLIIFLIFEYFRLELGWRIPILFHFIRPKEENRMYGVIYFLSATVICLAVFDAKIALAALLMTTFGDMVAALVGKRYGTTLIYRNKTWAGFIGELITNLIVGFAVLHTLPGSMYIIIGMSLAATFVETLVDELDDNLLIPIFSGFVGQLILFIL